MNNSLLQALNTQLTMERQNAAIYDALSAALDVVFWTGSSAWMKKSADEERTHAQRFSDYIIDRFGTPVYSALDGCNVPLGDDLPAFFDAALDREQLTTEAIKELWYTAEQNEDPDTCRFLLYFLEEQTKSEREIGDYLLMLNRLDKTGYLLFDNALK
jgi:ferritin